MIIRSMEDLLFHRLRSRDANGVVYSKSVSMLLNPRLFLCRIDIGDVSVGWIVRILKRKKRNVFLYLENTVLWYSLDRIHFSSRKKAAFNRSSAAVFWNAARPTARHLISLLFIPPGENWIQLSYMSWPFKTYFGIIWLITGEGEKAHRWCHVLGCQFENFSFWWQQCYFIIMNFYAHRNLLQNKQLKTHV